MQLNITTDYAVRIILCLAIKNTTVSSKEIAGTMGIPQNYVLKISRALASAEFIKKVSGVNGGLYLIKRPEDITLFDIINTMEPTTRLNRCLECDKYCSRHASNDCPVRDVYCKAQDAWENTLKDVTIKSLLDK